MDIIMMNMFKEDIYKMLQARRYQPKLHILLTANSQEWWKLHLQNQFASPADLISQPLCDHFQASSQDSQVQYDKRTDTDKQGLPTPIVGWELGITI